MAFLAPLNPGQAAIYEEFYRFEQPPFTLAPDPRFLYQSDSHAEALTRLREAIGRREGIIVLSGDIGTGKTTLCRALLQQVDSSTFTSLLLNPFLSVEELLRAVLLDFGIVSRAAARIGQAASASRQELLKTLEEFLVSLRAIRGRGVLIIDEAQHLSPEVLGELQVISNLEANDTKLLQIVLVGQLNLLDTLAKQGMRPFKERISLQTVLRPLTRDEVDAYITHRLTVAKGANNVKFEAGALDQVHAYSDGVPRVINLLCDRALMIGAERQVHDITADIIHDAADRLSLPSRRPLAPRVLERTRQVALYAGIAALVITLIVLVAPLYRLLNVNPPPLPDAPRMRTTLPLSQPAPPEPEPAPAP